MNLYGFHERYKKAEGEYPKYPADYESHEAGLYRQAAEGKQKAEESKPYFDTMYQTVKSILGMSENIRHPYLDGGTGSKKGVIVITSNRGLAGGYNSNITKLLTRGDLPKEDVVVYAVGKKGKDALERSGYHIAADYSEVMDEPSYHDAMHIGRRVLEAFEQGEIGEIYLAYTVFKNTVVHIPVMNRLLPVSSGAVFIGKGILLQAVSDSGTVTGEKAARSRKKNLQGRKRP